MIVCFHICFSRQLTVEPSGIIKVSQVWALDYEAIYELRLFASVLLGELCVCARMCVYILRCVLGGGGGE